MPEQKSIELNHRPYPYRDGMTIGGLMEENAFVFNHIIVKINGVIVEEELWPSAAVLENDKVEIIHVFGGG